MQKYCPNNLFHNNKPISFKSNISYSDLCYTVAQIKINNIKEKSKDKKTQTCKSQDNPDEW